MGFHLYVLMPYLCIYVDILILQKQINKHVHEHEIYMRMLQQISTMFNV